MKPARRSFDDHPFRWPPRARRDICGCGAPPMGFMPENRFGAGGKRGVLLILMSSGPCDSAHVWLGVSFGLVGVGGARFDRIRVRFDRIRVRFDRIRVRFDRIRVRFDRIRVRFDRTRVRFDRTRVRFDRIRVRFDRIRVRFDRFFVLLSMNLGESARIKKFGERHHHVFRHSHRKHLPFRCGCVILPLIKKLSTSSRRL